MEGSRRAFLTALTASFAAPAILRATAAQAIPDRLLDARLSGVELEDGPRLGRSPRLRRHRAAWRRG